MRIGVSGAYGTGKTTLVEDLCARLAGHAVPRAEMLQLRQAMNDTLLDLVYNDPLQVLGDVRDLLSRRHSGSQWDHHPTRGLCRLGDDSGPSTLKPIPLHLRWSGVDLVDLLGDNVALEADDVETPRTGDVQVCRCGPTWTS
ncbi:hypothetical protein [Nonomuraea sp. NPDC046570]|uniref:hypothetical protein n=1 Tax=Nonomuraea sp. NPDC046570 TaxID=3155255 RepID=UPI0033DE76C4